METRSNRSAFVINRPSGGFSAATCPPAEKRGDINLQHKKRVQKTRANEESGVGIEKTCYVFISRAFVDFLGILDFILLAFKASFTTFDNLCVLHFFRKQWTFDSLETMEIIERHVAGDGKTPTGYSNWRSLLITKYTQVLFGEIHGQSTYPPAFSVESFLPDLTGWHQELQKSAEASPPDSRSARKRQKTRCKTIQSAGFKVGYHGGLWKTWKTWQGHLNVIWLVWEFGVFHRSPGWFETKTSEG